MSLARATRTDGTAVSPPGDPPYRCADLIELASAPFVLPCDDPWVLGGGDAAHAYLDGARDAWDQWPDWMDHLDPTSPAHDVKRASRDVYLHWWSGWLGAGRVLDAGCGIGRIAIPLLDRGADVWGVDADLRSLQALAAHAAGRPGRLDLAWTSVHALPDVGDLDLAVACEVLCYVPEVESALAGLVERLRPGGTLLISMEARWGWALGPDAPTGGLSAALAGQPEVATAGSWVRTWDEPELRALLDGAGLDVDLCAPTHYVPEGPLEDVAPDGIDLPGLLDAEEACRDHPIWRPLNRVWTAAATRR